MASRREIAITIKGNVGTGGGKEISYSKSVSSAVSTSDTANKETSKYSQATNSKGKGAWKVIGLYALNNARNSIISGASLAWNRYIDMKEDYLAQNNMNQIKAHLGAAKSYASSAITGAQIGAAFGPVGAVVGAAVGTVGNVVNRAMNYGITVANYNEQNNAMNAATNYSRVRMGLMDGGRGTEN